MLLVAGTTRTASIEGISAAGADPDAMVHTPGADAEIVTYGEPVRAGVVPVSPTGCPTPAVVTRAVREVVGFEFATVDAGLAGETAAPTIDVGASPGCDVRNPEAVPDAGSIFDAARSLGATLPGDHLRVAESIPGGTTTALGVLEALGERASVSSSLPSNPLALKREVVGDALEASGLCPGECAGDPIRAIRSVGDPVLAAVAGLAVGAGEAGASVRLAGGTQQLAAAALARHAGFAGRLVVSTTTYIAGDDSADVRALADDVDADLVVTDPGFAGEEHVVARRFETGEAKDGVGMGETLRMAADAGALPAVRERIEGVYDRMLAEDDVPARSDTDNSRAANNYSTDDGS